MLRASNPFNKILEGSVCRFDLLTKDPLSFSAELSHELSLHGGRFESMQEGNFWRNRLDIGHDQVDAAGGLFLISKLAENKAGEIPLAAEGQSECSVNGYQYRQIWIGRPTMSSDQTFPQRFAEGLMNHFPFLRDEKIGFVLSVESLREISNEFKWGNSVVMHGFLGSELMNLCRWPKDEWRAYVDKIGKRVLKIASRVNSEGSPFDSILISNFGPFDRLPWAAAFHPSEFLMVPTPKDESCANIATWSSKDASAVVVCAKSDHWAFQHWDEFVTAWKESVK